MKTELVDIIIKEVSKATDIKESDILGYSRLSDVVDARCIAMHYMFQYGISDKYIQNKFKRESITSIKNLQKLYYNLEKTNFTFREVSKHVDKAIADILKQQ